MKPYYSIDKLIALAKNLSDFERNCAITVALKIADETCKMDAYEKSIFMMLYESLKEKQSAFFDESVSALISHAKHFQDEETFSQIAVLREAAMESITRPKMKAFKASVRARITVNP